MVLSAGSFVVGKNTVESLLELKSGQVCRSGKRERKSYSRNDASTLPGDQWG
ncbi:hypothetical protein Bca4012_003241 [Brassica carinata]